MITLEWLLVAKGVTIDRDSSALTIFGTTAGIRAEGFPVMLPQLAVAALLRRKTRSGSGKYTIRLDIAHNRDKLFDSKLEVDFQDKLNNHLAVTLQGMLITSPGTVSVTLSTRSKPLGKFYFNVDGPATKVAKAIERTTASGSSISPKTTKSKRSKKS